MLHVETFIKYLCVNQMCNQNCENTNVQALFFKVYELHDTIVYKIMKKCQTLVLGFENLLTEYLQQEI